MNITLKVGCAMLAASSLALHGQQPGATNPSDAAPTQTAPATQSASPATAPTATPNSNVAPATAPAPQTPNSPSNAAPAVDNAHYIIGPEDVLQITVWREPTLSGSLPVRPDGMISMVLLGDVPAAGMTPTQLGENISQRLQKLVRDPLVTVQVMGDNSQKIYLIGEVLHVGPIPLTADMSPLKAIATAGGLSPFANSKHIYILRGSGSTKQKIPFNYKQALKGDDRQQITLRPGDTIVVP